MNLSEKNRFRPKFEMLETRDLMSVTSVTLTAGLLKVQLGAGGNDVRISEKLDLPVLTMASAAAPGSTSPTSPPSTIAPHSVFVGPIVNLHPTLTIHDRINGNTWNFDRSKVQAIAVEDLTSDSFGDIVISSSSLPTFVDLKNTTGANQVETGEGADTVLGGRGANTIKTHGGIDALFSISQNDDVDGGAAFDQLFVKAGHVTAVNIEKTTISSVPGGNPKTDSRSTALQAANRFLESYGLPRITHGIVLNDSHSGLTSDRELNLVRERKPDAVRVRDASLTSIAGNVKAGRPVLTRFGVNWVVINGFDSTTGLFSFIGKDGLQHSSPLDLGSRDIIV